VEWEIARLDGVADVLDSMRKPINATERNERIFCKAQSELYLYYGATGQVGYIDDYIFEGEYVLLGEDGAPFLDKNAAKAYVINGKAWVNNHAHILEARIDTSFLCHALNALDYDGYVNGTTRLKLTQADMNGIILAVPPLSEQKRIADTIAALYRILDEITSSIA
jgi:type I restriction enzyme S subunit